jgi:RNA polymerase sigma factor (sigma-70 family)
VNTLPVIGESVLTNVIHTESDTLPESDAALIERSWREPERFAEVFDRYHTEIHGYVSRRLGPSLADDVASDTFLHAFDRRRRYDTSYTHARAWLYGIASNLVARHRRAEMRRYRALARTDTTNAVEGHADRVVVRLDAQALRPRLAKALVQIAAADRVVAGLRLAIGIVDKPGERP